jgi:hypothetical protein
LADDCRAHSEEGEDTGLIERKRAEQSLLPEAYGNFFILKAILFRDNIFLPLFVFFLPLLLFFLPPA